MMRGALNVCVGCILLSLCFVGISSAGHEWWQAVGEGAPIIDIRGDFTQLADSADWNLDGDFTTTPDEVFGSVLSATGPQQLTLQGTKVLPAQVELSCRVRLRTSPEHPSVSFTVSMAQEAPEDRGIWLTLSARDGSDAVSIGFGERAGELFPAPQEREVRGWTPIRINSLSYNLRAFTSISEGWPQEFRARIEKDMSSLPHASDKWLGLRYEVRGGRLRLWVDDRLVADKREFKAEAGTIRLALSAGCQLGYLQIAASPPVPARFHPLVIDDYCNSTALCSGGEGTVGVSTESLPYGGKVVSIDGTPFRFADRAANAGRDNIDLEPSLFRYRNWYGGYLQALQTWRGAMFKDPARIQLRIPNGRYEALWVVAAADGKPPSIPTFSAVFYRPTAGFPKSFTTEVPLFSASSGRAKPLPVTLTDGRRANLWLVRLPLDPGALSSFSDMPFLEIELTKSMQQMRSYPDPFYYSFHQAGLPSGVHIYAITLEEPPIEVTFEPTRFGHVFTSPTKPGYKVRIHNRTEEPKTVNITLRARSYDGTQVIEDQRRRTVASGVGSIAVFKLNPKRYGWHELNLTAAFEGRKWTERRSFVYLAPDEREPEWTGDGPLFGFWGYGAGHYGPLERHEAELMHEAGARARAMGSVNGRLRMKQGGSAWVVQLQDWAMEDEYSEEEYKSYGDSIVEAYRQYESRPEYARPDHGYFFPEPRITRHIPQIYFGLPEYQLTPDEKRRARGYIRTAMAAAEAIRRDLPDLKIYLPWGDPLLFTVYALREGYPCDLFDGVGIDIPTFERLPERQICSMSIHNLWILKQEFARHGCLDKELVHCEGTFVPTEPGACTWRQQQDYFIRWYLLSMAYGVKKFYAGLFGFDCGDYYGAEHYGGCGSFRRIPYCDPKPVYGAYATMTAMLEHAEFDKWLPTGSLSTYCLRFERTAERGPVYALWTLRGKRLATLRVPADAKVVLTDIQDNSQTLQNDGGKVTIQLSTSPVWVTGTEQVSDIALGAPDHSDAAPAQHCIPLDDFSKPRWRYDAGRDESYENNHWETFRFPAALKLSYVPSSERNGQVLQVKLPEPETDPRLMPLYGRLVPDKPIQIPGKASALGLWVKGDSSWGRVIYKLRDAKGEIWTSIGSKDEYNCDDVHSLSFFNFDGWRYLRFPLPSHAPYDSFRELETTWWKSEGGDDVVDLPLTLEEIIVEMRTHVLYVNSPVEVPKPRIVQFAELVAEYASDHDMDDVAVAQSAIRMPAPLENAVK